MSAESVTIETCMERIRSYITNPDDLALIEKAWQTAHKAHSGQFRKSGEPYEIHVIQVAYILAGLHSEPQTIAAGFLHDVVEDCEGYTYETIKEEFNTDIADLVEAVTKVGKISKYFKDEQEYLASNHRKIFIAMARDPRVIYIKLADRLHNLRTLQYQPPAKQQKIARETLEVYAPIAHRLGISVIKNELEDISFKYLNEKEYQNIKGLVAHQENERRAQVDAMIRKISDLLKEKGIAFEAITGRSKHFYSIYKKMKNKNKKFNEILDLQAIRIITENKQDCYDVLGQIHSAFLPIPGRFKDYIAVPKDNMYQSLHTIVKIPDDSAVIEIQIRTREMDEAAEVGIAAHFRYKEKKGSMKEDIEDQLTWFRGFALMAQEESDNPMEFMRSLYNDIFSATLYCFTPKGKVISLPQDSTPIDFAYRIHTEIGHHTVGAKVNGAIVPLNTQLKMGDIVEILTNRNSAGPSRDWIQHVKSAHARNKIRAFFQRKDSSARREQIHQGEEMILQYLKKNGIHEGIHHSRTMESAVSALSFKSLDELLMAVAAGRLSVQKVADFYLEPKSTLEDNQEVLAIYNKPDRKVKPTACGILVPGIDNIQVSLASCCSPIPGDEVVGFISKSKGIKVHRKDCPNLDTNQKSRNLPVEWAENNREKLFKSHLTIYSQDRNFLLSDIVTVLQQNQVNLRHIDSKVNHDELTATTKVEVGVQNLNQLDTLISNLRKVRSVLQVERTIL